MYEEKKYEKTEKNRQMQFRYDPLDGPDCMYEEQNMKKRKK